MSLKTDPELGINSWLEDELYQQYLNDRTAVDESWKHVFEDGAQRRAPRPHRRPAAARLRACDRARRTTSSPCAAPPAASPRT